MTVALNQTLVGVQQQLRQAENARDKVARELQAARELIVSLERQRETLQTQLASGPMEASSSGQRGTTAGRAGTDDVDSRLGRMKKEVWGEVIRQRLESNDSVV